MHILIIPSWYSAKHNPIRGSFFRDQALALVRAGHQVGMLVPPSRFRTFNGLREVAANWHKSPTAIEISNDSGIIVYRMPWWGWLPTIFPLWREKLVLQVFEQYCQAQGIPQILHGHSILYGGYLAAFIGKKRAIPSILTEHSSLFLTNGYQIGHNFFIRDTLSSISKVTTVGSALCKALQAYDKQLDISLVGNVVNTDQFVPSMQQPPLSPFVVSIFGRLDTNKAQDILLKAFAQAFQGKDAKLKLVGDGRKRTAYEQLAQQLGIASQVQFYGQVDRARVIEIMQASHLIVSSSYIETFGVSLIEAMACGKPVVTTRSGGPEAFVDKRNGILVPVGDVNAVAHALTRIRENYSAYNPHEIRQIAINRFSEKAIAQELTTHYESLLS
jgi:glycosyltransferase involved in cell wall biosynthesis